MILAFSFVVVVVVGGGVAAVS